VLSWVGWLVGWPGGQKTRARARGASRRSPPNCGLIFFCRLVFFVFPLWRRARAHYSHHHRRNNTTTTTTKTKTKKNTNHSLTCAPCDWLDGKHVAFGRVLDDPPPHGLFLLRKMEHVATGPQSRPRIPVLITECGEM